MNANIFSDVNKSSNEMNKMWLFNLDKSCNWVWLSSIHCINKAWGTKTFVNEVYFWVFAQDIWHSILGC
jgi:hypothetical protein